MQKIIIAVLALNLILTGYALYAVNANNNFITALGTDTGNVLHQSNILIKDSEGKLLVNRVVTFADLEELNNAQKQPVE